MAADLETLQARLDAITDPQSTDAELLKLNIQMEMLRTQKKMLKRWASIDIWITIIGLVFLIILVLTFFGLIGSVSL